MVSVGGKRVVVVIGLIASLLYVDAWASDASEDSLGQSITLARLEEIAAIGALMSEHTWPGFDPLTYPAIFYEPDGWAFAIGFTEPPSGFTAVEGTKQGMRQLYHAAPGSFTHQGRSPAIIQGKWTIISRFDPPEPLPAGARMGRESGEEGLGRFFGDAFAIYLMEKRKTTTPFATGAAAYPESAELMAMTTLEQRTLITPLQMSNLYEKNIDEFHRYVKTVVAVRHVRWKLMGEELAAIEKDVELTEGLRLFTATMVHRHAMNKMLVSTNPGKTDGSFVNWVNATALRIIGLGYPMMFTLDNPAVTVPQVAIRGAILGGLLDKTAAPWRPQAIEAKLSLIDLLAQIEKITPEEEPSLIDSAKQAYNYEALLNLARADIDRLKPQRETCLQRILAGGAGQIEIVLPSGDVESYADDPWRTEHLGGGRLTHPGGLTLRTGGLELEASVTGLGAGGSVLTEAGVSRRSVRLVHIVLPPGARVMVGGKPYKPVEKPYQLTELTPLTLEAPGLKLRATKGSIARKSREVMEVTIIH